MRTALKMWLNSQFHKSQKGAVEISGVVTTLIMGFIGLTLVVALTPMIELIEYTGTDATLTALVPIAVMLLPLVCIVGVIVGTIYSLKHMGR